VNSLVSTKYKKKMQYWGDIVLQYVANLILSTLVAVNQFSPPMCARFMCRQPDLIHTLPKDAISLIWGYEASHPFDQQCKV
jgi:hypothetical protein